MSVIDSVGCYYQIGNPESGSNMYTLSVTIDAASGLLQVLTVAESDSPSSLFLYLGCKGFVCSHANCTVKK